jgi:Cu/Zn superoxide dismutase
MKLLGLSLVASFVALAACQNERTPEQINPTAIPAKPLAPDEPIAEKPLSDETVFDRTVSEKTVAEGTASDTAIPGRSAGSMEADDPAIAAQPAPTAKPATKNSRTYGSAKLKGMRTDGTATFSGDDAGLTKVLIDVKNAPKGTYEVHVFEGSDCQSIANMETPFKGGPGTAGEGKIGTPGPKTTLALWKNLGDLTIDETGKGKIEVALDNEAGDKIDQRMVVIYPDNDDAKKGKQQTVIACGPVTVENAG